MSKQFSVIGTIIDADSEEVVPYLNGLTYGHLCNIKKMLEIEYQRVETTKEAINKKLLLSKLTSKERTECIKVKDQLYIALQRIEDKCTIIESIKASKKVSES
jgi:hypothetical protein